VGERVPVDFFAVDFDALEEGVVEEAPLGGVGLEVGGLDVVGEVEREVERFEDGFVVGLVAAEELVGGDAFAADPLLLVVEDVVADQVGVVGGEEFALFVVEPDQFAARPISLSAIGASPSMWPRTAVRTRSRCWSVSWMVA
jgi:hypothetical protein